MSASALLKRGGGLWHDPRQPRRLLNPTGWSGPFACLRTRAVRLDQSSLSSFLRSIAYRERIPLQQRQRVSDLRAVVFIVGQTKKGTSRSGQEYESSLLVLSGTEYAATSFQALHDRLCTALRGDRPGLALHVLAGDGTSTLIFDDGSAVAGPPITGNESPDKGRE